MQALVVVLLLACSGGGKDEVGDGGATGDGGGDGGGLPWDGGGAGDGGGGTTEVDNDGDGHPFGEDCDDADPEVFPGAEEICNGKDDDCDPGTDEADWILADGLQWNSLQEAIDGVTEGEAVQVCSGTYKERLVIDRDVLVLSRLGADFTALDVSGLGGTALTVTSGTVTFAGFTIRGGSGSDPRGLGDLQGGGVYVAYPAVLQLSDVKVTGNSADRGGGVFADEGVVLNVVNSVIEKNKATTGAGLSGVEAEIVIGASEITENEATGHGGGMAGREVVFRVNGGKVLGNLAASGGGASTTDDSTLVVVGSDWGASGDEDNSPEDVWTAGGSYSFEVGANFSCNVGGCD